MGNSHVRKPGQPARLSCVWVYGRGAVVQLSRRHHHQEMASGLCLAKRHRKLTRLPAPAAALLRQRPGLTSRSAVLHCSADSQSQIPERPNPMKKMSAVFAAAALACTLNLTAAAQDKPAPKLKRVQMAKEREMHPEISAAMTHLREAKQNLENAKHD